MTAEEIILGELNKGFDGEWKSLQEAVEELNDELIYCSWDKGQKTIQWLDNGKGETYIISRINESALNEKWQTIAELC
jgi:hypothetical protein